MGALVAKSGHHNARDRPPCRADQPGAFGDDFKFWGVGWDKRATVEGLLQGRERKQRTIGIYDTQEDAARLQRRDRRAASKAAARRTRSLTGNWCRSRHEAAVAQAPPRRVDRRRAVTARPPPPLGLGKRIYILRNTQNPTQTTSSLVVQHEHERRRDRADVVRPHPERGRQPLLR